MFDEKDLQQIREHGLTPEQAETQLENFRRGFPFLNVVRAASPGDGVLVVGAAEADAAVERYEKESAGLGVVKFVPASGAATRMFKELFEFVNDGKRGKGIDTLLFRPAGHGALIENLNEIDADLIFIKNIDNVTTDARRGDTVRYKKVLAGVLLDLQGRAFEYLKALEVGGAELEPIAEFIEKQLCVKLPTEYDSALLRAVLDRPIRVCGMVRNEGEPGGGPFWVGNPDGTESLQIAESSQIAPDDLPLMQSATHFNPVDLVCGVRDSKGCKFDLRRYTDPATGFISSKSSGGRDLRAQELPGLWNGAMAKWNTVFVDVPVTTFSPVKVVQDLLRPQHQ